MKNFLTYFYTLVNNQHFKTTILIVVVFTVFSACSVQNCSTIDEDFTSYEEAVTIIEQTTFKFGEACDTNKSSWIDGAIFYSCDMQTGYLFIRVNGTNYIYQNVPINVWKNFKKADSYGKYYNANIKGKFGLELSN